MELSNKGVRLFRNQVGTGWQIHNGKKYFIHFGLMKGSSDLIGWTPTIITPDMVGKKIAIFTGIEIKAKNGRESEEQINWHKTILENGAISKIIYDNGEEID